MFQSKSTTVWIFLHCSEHLDFSFLLYYQRVWICQNQHTIICIKSCCSACMDLLALIGSSNVLVWICSQCVWIHPTVVFSGCQCSRSQHWGGRGGWYGTEKCRALLEGSRGEEASDKIDYGSMVGGEYQGCSQRPWEEAGWG